MDAGKPTGSATSHGSPVRLRCGVINQKVTGDHFEVTVMLEYRGREFAGYAACRNSEQQRRTCIASATLSAVHAFLGIQASPFKLMSVKRITSTPVPISMVLMEFTEDKGTTVLVGAAEMDRDEGVSVQRATMDAINRKITGLYKNQFQ